jgi:hypothetical protein
MPMKIILRDQANINIFRDLIINTISLKIGDSIIICSGFFQQGRGGYFSSCEKCFCCQLKKSGKKITTIGIHNPNWLPEYRLFVNFLRQSGVNITGRLYKGFHWHAKVYLVLDKNKPIFGIIGSSNLTRNAFSSSAPFNVEVDVVMWNDGIPNYDKIVNEILPSNNFDNYYTIQYNTEDNNNLKIEDRLNHLKKYFDNEEFTEI